jgi:hypothetical protein
LKVFTVSAETDFACLKFSAEVQFMGLYHRAWFEVVATEISSPGTHGINIVNKISAPWDESLLLGMKKRRTSQRKQSPWAG